MSTAFARSSLLLMVALACGGEQATDSRAASQSLYDPCEDRASLETLAIADFEAVPAVSWYTGMNNVAPGARLSPLPPATATTPLEASKCPGDGSAGSAFHIVATGLGAQGSYSFGFNGLNALPNAGGSSYFDTSGWDGVALWVRKGPGPSSSTIFASVAERFTDPSGSGLFTAAEASALLDTGTFCDFNAGDINGDGASDPQLSQCDRFGVGIGIATDWRFFKVPFNRMRQRAYGRPSLLPTPDPRLLGLEFGLEGESWDFWIDDLVFYREPR